MHMLHSICGFPAHAGVLHHLEENGEGTLLLAGLLATYRSRLRSRGY